jgi:hypothetical protein
MAAVQKCSSDFILAAINNQTSEIEIGAGSNKF